MEIYTFPFDDHYIVYRSLLRLAFAANTALVNRIAAMAGTASEPSDNMDKEFTISCDGSPAVQNAQRPRISGEGAWHNVMTTIRLLDREKSHYGIRLTVTNRSIAHLTESIRFFCQETDCRVFQVEPAFSQGRADRNQTVLTQIDPFIEAQDIAVSYGRHLYYSGAHPWLITDMFCQSPYSSMVVRPDGEISSCFEVIDPVHPLHETFRMGAISLNDAGVEDSPVRRQLLAEIADHRRQCRHCFCY